MGVNGRCVSISVARREIVRVVARTQAGGWGKGADEANCWHTAGNTRRRSQKLQATDGKNSLSGMYHSCLETNGSKLKAWRYAYPRYVMNDKAKIIILIVSEVWFCSSNDFTIAPQPDASNIGYSFLEPDFQFHEISEPLGQNKTCCQHDARARVFLLLSF